MANLGWIKRVTSGALIGVAIVLTAATTGQAQGMSAHGGGPGSPEGHHNVDGNRDGRFDVDHDFDRDRHHGRYDPWRYWGHPYYRHPPYYGYSAPAYYYYCPSARTYYPYVTSCRAAWVLIPAS